MPGIFGIVLKTDGDCVAQKRRLDSMAAAMQYDSRYACRRYESSGLGVFVGWVGRASDVSSRGPLSIPTPALTLFFAGEPRCDAAFVENAAQHRADTDQPDALRLLGHYERSGTAFLSKLTGSFSGFLIDEDRECTTLFGDRLGIERVFIHEDSETLLFSSEAKAILAAAPHTRAFDSDGLAQFLACGCTFGEASLFRDVRVLPGGTVLEIGRKSEPRRRQYFDRTSWEGVDPLPERVFFQDLADRFDRALARDAAPPDVAISLTGGVDSRIIMASLNAPPATVPCYTFGSMYRDTYDVRVARRVALSCGQKHQVLELGPEFVRDVADYFEKAVYVSDGYIGLSGAAELYLNRLASHIAPIRVTGNYGGELLRAFRAFKGSEPEGDVLEGPTIQRIRRALNVLSELEQMPAISFTLFCQAPAGYGRYAVERSQLTPRSPFLDDAFLSVLYRRPPALAGESLSVALIERRRRDLLQIATDRGLLGRGGRIGCTLRRVYREGMFKAEYWTGHGAPSWMSAAARWLPEACFERPFVGRHKFLHPRVWLRGALGTYIWDVLAAHSTSLPDEFNRTRILAMARRNIDGAGNQWEALDRIVTTALASGLLLRPPWTPVSLPPHVPFGAGSDLLIERRSVSDRTITTRVLDIT